MRTTLFQAIKLLFGLLGFVGILVGYRGSDYPVQANPSPMFLPTPRTAVTPMPTSWETPHEALRTELRESLRSR